MPQRSTITPVLVVTLFLCTLRLSAQVSMPMGVAYQWMKSSQIATTNPNWFAPEYEDAAWTSGASPFRYGDGVGGTLLSDMMNNYTSVLLRRNLEISSLEGISTLEFSINYDDGFVLWINGEKVLQRNAPTDVTPASLAVANHESGSPEAILVAIANTNLHAGTNLLAVQCMNVDITSSDLYFDMAIREVIAPREFTSTIDTLRATYSNSAGFYDVPFMLTLSPPAGTYGLLYTLDGSNPITSEHAIESQMSVEIPIDPQSADGRPVTPGFTVRSCVLREKEIASFPRSTTYLFIGEVKNQTYPGGEWPVLKVNSQVLDYELAQDVLTDPRYRDSIEIALKALPSISLTTDASNLFDPGSGIYANAGSRGEEGERDASVELIYPDGSVGFQVNAGLRIRGGSSRDGRNAKHSWRLFFRGKYGDAKLHYPLFEEEGADEFDKIDLRTGQNYSWNADEEENQLNTLVRDVFSRDLQRAIGQPYTRSRYYHLYLNGMYWGIFQTQERAEANFAETYFGDAEENYDVMKVNPVNYPYKTELTDGNDKAWKEIYNLCNVGFTNNAAYFNLEGKNALGEPVVGKKVLVDIDNLIDYLLIIFYTGNFDAPVSAFGGNKMPNNFYAIYNREDNNEGFKFMLHDSEHSLMIDPVYAGAGLYENRINIADRTDWFKMEMNSYADFHPQWIHYKLSHLPEYQQRFADRAYKLFGPEGVFTPEKAVALFESRVSEIETAIIVESARWGDARWPVSRTKDDDWIPQLNTLRKTFFPQRTQIVINQLKEANLYTSMLPPLMVVSDESTQQEVIHFESPITLILSNPNASGELHYTLDGTDPRLVGGVLSDKAVKATTSSVQLDIAGSAVIRARIKNGTAWSAIRELKALKADENYTDLKITELNYHPLEEVVGLDTIDGDDFEFVEFKNSGTNAINLSGLRLDSAISYAFPVDAAIPPGGFFVIARKPADFYNRYGLHASGNYSKSLSNSGEYFVMYDANDQKVMEFTWSDKSPWPEAADGDGYTLVSSEFNPTGSPADLEYWKSSRYINGSPFADDGKDPAGNPIAAIEPERNEVIAYPNPTKGMIYIQLGEVEKTSQQIPVEIRDLSGRVLFAETMSVKQGVIQLDLSEIPNGMYVISCQRNNGTVFSKICIRR